MPIFQYDDEAEPVEVIGTGDLWMNEGKFVYEGDRAWVTPALAMNLVRRGKAVFAEGEK